MAGDEPIEFISVTAVGNFIIGPKGLKVTPVGKLTGVTAFGIPEYLG